MMQQIVERLWTLSREPKGPLVAYLDPFAKQLVEQGFRQKHLGPQIRVAANFSRWLHVKRVAAKDVTDEHGQRFLQTRRLRRFVTQGGVAALRRLMDFLCQVGVIRKQAERSKPTPVQQIVDLFGRYLRQEQELSDKTLRVFYPSALEMDP